MRIFHFISFHWSLESCLPRFVWVNMISNRHVCGRICGWLFSVGRVNTPKALTVKSYPIQTAPTFPHGLHPRWPLVQSTAGFEPVLPAATQDFVDLGNCGAPWSGEGTGLTPYDPVPAVRQPKRWNFRKSLDYYSGVYIVWASEVLWPTSGWEPYK